MENLNAENITNEIQSLIKALKDCGGWVKRGNGEGWFNHEILADALALINSQEQRIKELADEKSKVFEKGAENLTRLEEAYLKLEAENLKLTEENERLFARNLDLAEKGEQVVIAYKKLSEENDRLRAENKTLTNDNAEMKNQIQEEISEEDINLFDEFTKQLHEGIREAKSDTVRKMQQRLKETISYITHNGIRAIPLKVIDQIAKEMLEGEK